MNIYDEFNSYMNENINALFITSNLIRHNNSYSSTRKKLDNFS